MNKKISFIVKNKNNKIVFYQVCFIHKKIKIFFKKKVEIKIFDFRSKFFKFSR